MWLYLINLNKILGLQCNSCMMWIQIIRSRAKGIKLESKYFNKV
jgi:hypothetical protein